MIVYKSYNTMYSTLVCNLSWRVVLKEMWLLHEVRDVRDVTLEYKKLFISFNIIL
jgi:hypothetical protein